MSRRTGRNGLHVAATAAAALALAGCAADYVGDDWQCPLAQGSVCTSVAAADPAVPQTRTPQTPGPAVLLPAARAAELPPGAAPPYRRLTEGAAAEAAFETDCASECNPLAWLAGLFGELSEPAEAGRTEGSGLNDHAATGEGTEWAAHGHTPAAAREHATTAAADTRALDTAGVGGTDAAEAEAATDGPPPLPDRAVAVDTAIGAADADAASAAPAPGAHDGALHDGLRAPETVARVWIAPWVDADGIYREGAWVRAVIAPAAWRLR